jgi:hypothetical protein
VTRLLLAMTATASVYVAFWTVRACMSSTSAESSALPAEIERVSCGVCQRIPSSVVAVSGS